MGNVGERVIDGQTYHLTEDLLGHTHAWETPATPPRDIALVGCGTWGKNLLRNLGERVAFVCDSDPEAREWAYTATGGRVYVTGHLEAVLENPGIKAVVIAAPPARHYILADHALRAGKHVFVEKPMAMTVEEGRQLLALAEHRQGLVLMVGHLMRYHPGFRALQELVESGKLGDLRYLYAVRGKLGGVRQEPDVLWSFAPHDISMILALVGKEPFKVQAMGGAYLRPGVPDVTAVDLDFGDVQANLFVNWLHPVKEQRLVVVGDKGIAVFRDGAGADTLVVHPYEVDGREPVPGEPYQIPVERAEPLAREVAEFLDCVDDYRQPLTDGAEGLRVLQVLEDAQRSMREGQSIFANARPNPAWYEELIQELQCPVQPEIGEDCCKTMYTVHPLAEVETDDIGEGTTIWRWTHVMPGAKIGKGCMIGQGCFIGEGVVIGDGCRIQNGAQLFQGVTLENRVFVGPGVVFTNDRKPRVSLDWRAEPTLVRYQASIGANATIRCGVVIGKGAMIGAGAVVTKDVPAWETWVGNPAHPIRRTWR